MSGTGLADPNADPNKPRMPNTVNLVPVSGTRSGTAASPAPTIPNKPPPNVVDSGGGASFSDVTGTIGDLLKSKTAAISASASALQANSAIDTQSAAALSDLTNKSLVAFGNMQDAIRLPGGGDGKLARILSLFDSDYNIDYQKNLIQENQLRAGQISSTADALKAANNLAPALYDKAAAASQDIFNAQLQANHLAIEAGQLQDARLRTTIDANRLRLEQAAGARQAVEFKIRSMSTAQLEAGLQSGAFKGFEGLVQERLVQEQGAEVALHNANNAAMQGDRDNFNNSLADFIYHLPKDFVQAKLQDAQRAGRTDVEFDLGKDKDGKPIKQNVPFSIVEAGLKKLDDLNVAANTVIATEYANRSSLMPGLQTVISGAMALQSVDPRAQSVIPQATAILQSIDPKNPNSIRIASTVLGQIQAKLADISKDVSERYVSTTAKAAVQAFGTTGTFDAIGGTSVVGDSIGIPALSTQSLYRGAWSNLNTQLATMLKAQHIIQTNMDPSQGADAQAMINAALQKPDGRRKIAELSAELLTDPKNQASIAANIAGVIRPQAVNNAWISLAGQKGADPIWKELIDHTERVMVNGKLSYQKLFEMLEQKWVTSGGHTNYTQAFMTAMQNYAANADNLPGADPRYTMQDHALEAAVYGGKPHGVILNDLVGDMHYQARLAHEAMLQRIQNDVTGKTQQEALQLMGGETDAAFAAAAGSPQIYVGKSPKEQAAFMATVPSSTGSGLKADDIKRMFGGRQP